MAIAAFEPARLMPGGPGGPTDTPGPPDEPGRLMPGGPGGPPAPGGRVAGGVGRVTAGP